MNLISCLPGKAASDWHIQVRVCPSLVLSLYVRKRSVERSPNSWTVPENEEQPIRSLKDGVITFLSILDHIGRRSCNWGEPERAPHRRDKRSQSIYFVYIYYGTSVTRAPLYILYSRSLWFYGPHEKLLRYYGTLRMRYACGLDWHVRFVQLCTSVLWTSYVYTNKAPKEDTTGKEPEREHRRRLSVHHKRLNKAGNNVSYI